MYLRKTSLSASSGGVKNISLIHLRYILPPFNSEGGSDNPNDHSHNTILLRTPVDVTTRPSIGSPSKIITFYSVCVISSYLKWNVFVSRLHCSISASIKPWSRLMWSRQLTYKNLHGPHMVGLIHVVAFVYVYDNK